ncbi:hypothetical protein AB0B01_25105 [Streptomyces sp. NPDC044571]|uniref:hypothetical protein n=1 Tax=Streptomyces sp. NPDC044571 TaxID=3155371 RepID=UPI003406613D
MDTASAGVTFVTTLRRLLAGKREASWGFPRAGVGMDELDRLALLGERLAELAPMHPEFAPEQSEPASRAASEEALADRVRDVLAAHDAAPVHLRWPRPTS